MDSSTQRVRDGLIGLGYCPASVDCEIMPWLAQGRIRPTGKWKTRLEVRKEYVGLTHPTRTPEESLSVLMEHINAMVQTYLVLKIIPFPVTKKAS